MIAEEKTDLLDPIRVWPHLLRDQTNPLGEIWSTYSPYKMTYY